MLVILLAAEKVPKHRLIRRLRDSLFWSSLARRAAEVAAISRESGVFARDRAVTMVELLMQSSSGQGCGDVVSTRFGNVHIAQGSFLWRRVVPTRLHTASCVTDSNGSSREARPTRRLTVRCGGCLVQEWPTRLYCTYLLKMRPPRRLRLPSGERRIIYIVKM